VPAICSMAVRMDIFVQTLDSGLLHTVGAIGDTDTHDHRARHPMSIAKQVEANRKLEESARDDLARLQRRTAYLESLLGAAEKHRVEAPRRLRRRRGGFQPLRRAARRFGWVAWLLGRWLQCLMPTATEGGTCRRATSVAIGRGSGTHAVTRSCTPVARELHGELHAHRRTSR
jgi:hypothetical protein